MSLGNEQVKKSNELESLKPVYSTRRAWAGRIGAFALGCGVSASGGFIGGGTIDYFQEPTVEPASEELVADWAAEVDRLGAELDRVPGLETWVSDAIPPSCKPLLDAYTTGTLGGVAEDSAVSDMLAEENQPCGDSPRKVREQLIPYREAFTALTTEKHNAQEAINSAQAELSKNTTSYEDYQEDVEFSGGKAGFKLGLGLGPLLGLAAAFKTRQSQRECNQELQSQVANIFGDIGRKKMIQRINALPANKRTKLISHGRGYGYTWPLEEVVEELEKISSKNSNQRNQTKGVSW